MVRDSLERVIITTYEQDSKDVPGNAVIFKLSETKDGTV